MKPSTLVLTCSLVALLTGAQSALTDERRSQVISFDCSTSNDNPGRTSVSLCDGDRTTCETLKDRSCAGALAQLFDSGYQFVQGKCPSNRSADPNGSIPYVLGRTNPGPGPLGIDQGECCSTVLGGCATICNEPNGCTGSGDCDTAP